MEPLHVRFQVFLERLREAPPAESLEEAFQQVNDILTDVENELTDIPCNPSNWQTDGRMYPPQMDNVRTIEGNVEVKRFRSRAHNTFIRANGAIEIQEAAETGNVILSKAGADGRTVWAE